jgi:hypothetical protein
MPVFVPAVANADASATSNGGVATADAVASARVRGDGVVKASEYNGLLLSSKKSGVAAPSMSAAQRLHS